MDSAVRPPTQECYRAGDLLIDVSRQTVTRDGADVPLPRLSFDLLVALAAAYPRVMTIDELMDTVWAPAIVNPETVSQRIKLLRQSLGDDPQEPRYIVGVRGRGYRMQATVTREAAANAVPAPAAASTAIADAPAKRPSARERRAWTIAAVALAGALLVLAVARVGTDGRVPSPAAGAGRSVAVLPFLDLSAKRDQEYFADGMSEEIIDLLTRVPGLRVPARTSSFSFKGTHATVGEIAKALHVDHVLEGSVRTAGDQLRITVQLIRADTGFHLWSATYERRIDDVFRTQDEIAGAVVRALQASLSNKGAVRPAPTMNAGAHADYLQGLYHYYRSTPVDNAKAIESLEQAVELDPRYADAWAALASARVDNYSDYARGDLAAARQGAYEAARRAIEIDPALSEAHVAMAKIFFNLDWNREAAAAELERAHALDPLNEHERRVTSTVLLASARFAESEAVARDAIATDPLNPWNYHALAFAEWWGGKPDDAARTLRRSLELPNPAFTQTILSVVLLTSGHVVEAAREAERETDPEERAVSRPLILDALGRHEEATRALKEAEAHFGSYSAYQIAAVYARRGEVGPTIDWLERAARQREQFVQFLAFDPVFQRVRDAPEIRDFLRRHHLSD